jgi:putative DNA primase/helicase
MQLDEITARRLDREEALIHFTYAYRVAGRWQQFVTTAMTREQADEEFHAKFPAITDYRVKSTPAVEIGMRGFYTLKSATLRQYFRDCGIDPETLTGEADMDALKRARDNLLTPERRDLLNNVLRIGGFNTEKGKRKPLKNYAKASWSLWGYPVRPDAPEMVMLDLQCVLSTHSRSSSS